MNVTPPEASTEYSKGPGPPGGGFRLPYAAPIGAGAALAAVLLVVADFLRLYSVRGVVTGRTVGSYGAGAHHGYALAVIGVAAAVLAIGVGRTASRPALLGVGLMGLTALLIVLLGDLPNVHQRGLIRLPSGRYAQIAAQAGPGFYVETLGAVLLLGVAVGGFILAGPPRPSRRRVT